MLVDLSHLLRTQEGASRRRRGRRTSSKHTSSLNHVLSSLFLLVQVSIYSFSWSSSSAEPFHVSSFTLLASFPSLFFSLFYYECVKTEEDAMSVYRLVMCSLKVTYHSHETLYRQGYVPLEIVILTKPNALFEIFRNCVSYFASGGRDNFNRCVEISVKFSSPLCRLYFIWNISLWHFMLFLH